MLERPAFLVLHPEFASTDAALVDATLARAALQIGDAWGTLEDDGHRLLTAHFLASAPNGEMSRMQSDKLETTYGREFDRMKRRIAARRLDLRTP